MAKVCFVLGEGGSEREFFPSLLQNKFGFEEYEWVKYPYIFLKDDVWWVMTFPPNISNRDGVGRLLVPDTYKELMAYKIAHMHHFGDDPEVHYLVLMDGDHVDDSGIDNKRGKVVDISSPILQKDPIVHLPKGEIENWFVAGLEEDFPYFDDKKKSEVRKLLKCDIENCIDCKEKLDEVLKDEISGLRMRIAQEVGQHFVLDKAKSTSKSYRQFIEDLQERGLI